MTRPVSTSSNISKGFFPFSLVSFHNNFFLRCHPFSNEVFQEPFYDWGAYKWLKEQKEPHGLLLNLIDQQHGIINLPANKPSCVIFHVSRCGSTIVSNFFAIQAKFRVVREPQTINDLLLEKSEDVDKRLVFDSLIRLFGQQNTSNTSSLILKTTSWNIFEVEFFREQLPDVPFIFVFRDPLEVMSSLLKQSNGMLLRKKNAPENYVRYLKTSTSQLAGMDDEEYTALILKAKLEKLHEIKERVRSSDLGFNEQNTFFIPYETLLKTSENLFAEKFSFNDKDISKMRELSKFKSKELTPVEFKNDGKLKRDSLSAKSLKFLNKYQVQQSWELLKGVQ